MTQVDDAGKVLIDDNDLAYLEHLGFDTESMTDEEISTELDRLQVMADEEAWEAMAEEERERQRAYLEATGGNR